MHGEGEMLLSGWQVNAENTDEDLTQIYELHWLLTELVLKLHLFEKVQAKVRCERGKNLESHARQHSPYISSSHEQRGTVVTR